MSIYSILVDLETLKNINRFICQTSDTSDEESVVINENNLLSALSVLDSYFETKEQMAAALLRSLVIAHGFENGNKRTAFIASTMICPCKCSHQKAADITLKIAKGELKDVDMIAKQLFTLNEDLFVDIPEVEYQLDSNIELKGPEPGEDTGVAGLLLDLIGKVADNINEFNQLQPNLENYPEISEMIKDFADDENEKLGKIQTALKTISPNAELIMNGAVEAEQEMDPGSPIDESLDDIEEDELDRVTQARFDLFHRGNYSLDQLRNDLESELQKDDTIEFLGIDAEALDPDVAYSYTVMGKVDPDNVSSIDFDFGNDGNYSYQFIEDCIAKAVANQNLEWGEYVDYEDITPQYKQYRMNEAYDRKTIDDYFNEVWDKYSDLRDSLYAFETAVEGNKELELAAQTFIRDMEEAAGDLWVDYQLYVAELDEEEDGKDIQ